MAKIGVFTAISVLLNLFLTFWLVNQYLSDIYFQQYVNGAIGQYYAFIVLTIGVGGGSGLGYIFLKKRHSDQSLVSKIQKSKSFKPVSPLSSTGSVAAPRSSLPTGAPPSSTSKHTVYAVPPLPKSSTPSSSRTTPSSTWSASGRPALESFPAQKQETIRQTSPPSQAPRVEPPRPSSPFSSSQQPLPLRSIGETSTRPPTSWSPQPSPAGEKRPESGPVFQKPGMDIGARQEASFPGQTPSQSSQSSPVPSKWGPPTEDKPGAGQWSEAGVRSIPPLPPKWTPPSGPASYQGRPGIPSGIPPPGQMPPRGPIPPGQGGPRPFVAPGPGRPGEPRPVAAPRPFRPDPNRPPPGMSPQSRPPQPTPRPAAPLAGPMPQPWTPPPLTPERKEQSPGNLQASATGDDAGPAKGGSEQKSGVEGGSGGEMDWDTALDTILKTLRKDRVGDSK